MPVLTRKLRRDIAGNAGVLLTVLAIIAVGTGSFIGLGSAHRILETSRRTYYHAYRFADFWVDVKKAPLSAVESIAKLPGIAEIQSRVIFDVILDVPGVIQPITGRLISTPTRGFNKTINGIHLIRGSGFSDDRDTEIILGEAFAKAHHLNPGDRIGLILNRKRESFTIVGTAISPEYVYMVRGSGDFAPDPEHFGILYVKENYAREVLDFKDACNQIVGQLVPGRERDVDVLLNRIDRMLEPYGVLATTPRERQASHRFLSDEIHGLEISAVIMPSIFLVVAALVLNIVMSRLADRQRTIIGTLKALGYSDRQVLTHYLSFGVAVGLAGGLAGIGLGILLATTMIEVYKIFFQFPTFVYQFNTSLMFLGIAFSLFFAVAGSAKGVWGVLKLHPAEAMRPRPPESGGAVFLERFPGLWRRLGFRTHIALRSLARNHGRTATSIISSALSSAIVLMTLCMRDSMFFLSDYQFDHVAHSDVDIGMRDEGSLAALWEAKQLPGVDDAEPVLGVVCDMRHGRQSRRVAITGLWPGHRLTTPMRLDLKPIDIPPAGLVLSKKLAEVLQVGAGEHLELTPVRGRRETVKAPIISIVDSYLGMECYADTRYLSRIVGESVAVNSVQLAVNPRKLNDLYRTIKELPNAQGIGVRQTTRQNLRNTFIKTMTFSLTLMIFFSGVIAFGSAVNASLTELADRRRDVSTFRVLGYRPYQIAGIFFRQNAVVFAAALLLAFPIGYSMIVLIASNYNTELFRMPVILWPHTVLLAAAIALVFVLVAQYVVYQQIRKLDWLEGIKVKE